MSGTTKPTRCRALTAAGKACRNYAVEGSDLCSNHLRGAGAPKSKLTPEVAERIVRFVSLGNYVETACVAAGVPRRTFYEWWQRGASTAAADAGFRSFRQRVEAAQAEAEALLAGQVMTGSRRSWQAAAWMLERMAPARWARVSQRETGPGDEIPAEFDPFAEVDELAEARRKRRVG